MVDRVVSLPLNDCFRVFNLDEFVLFVIEEVEGKIVFESGVGKEDSV